MGFQSCRIKFRTTGQVKFIDIKPAGDTLVSTVFPEDNHVFCFKPASGK